MASLGLNVADSPYIPVKNTSLVEIPAGRGVVLNNVGTGNEAYDTFVRLPTDAEASLVPQGLTVQAIPAGTWGFITNRPGMQVPCKSGAAVTRGATVTVSSVAGQNGKIIAAADGAAYVGWAMNATTAADEDILVRFQLGAHAL